MSKKIAALTFFILFSYVVFSQSYLESGNAKFEEKDYEGAIDYYWKASEEEPNNPKVWHNLALSQYRLESYGLAISNFTYALELDSLDAVTWFHRGLSYEHSNEGDEDLAIADYSKAYEIDPTFLNALYQKGYLQTKIESYDDAIIDLTKYIDAGGEDLANAYYLRAFCSNRNQFYDYDPMKDLEKAASLGKRDKFVIYEVAYRHRLSEEWDKAIEAYSKVIEKDAEYINAWHGRGLCKIFKDDKIGGCEDLHKAASLDSDYAKDDIIEYCKTEDGLPEHSPEEHEHE